MPRQRRWIRSNRLYEIGFHAVEGLPIPCTKYTRAILESILARAQELYPIKIGDHIFLPNHLHMLLVTKDPSNLCRFTGYVMKEFTESYKRLTGCKQKYLWIRRPYICELGSLSTATQRIAYFYLNATTAGLESTIERYPGLNSWAYRSSGNFDPDHEVKRKVKHIRRSSISPLPHPSLSREQDEAFTSNMLARSKSDIELVLSPYAWITVFVPDASTLEIKQNQDAVERLVRQEEEKLEAARAKKHQTVLGARRLITQSIKQPYSADHLVAHRRGYMCDNTQDRIDWATQHKDHSAQCVVAFEAWKNGDFSAEWPAGFYRPHLPPLPPSDDG